MIELPGAFARWLGDGGLPVAVRFMKVLFLLVFAFAFVFAVGAARSARRPIPGRGATLFLTVIGLLFGAVYVNQATWQLGGFARPKFVQFMRRYDRRPDRAADRIARGRILDANGIELAANDPDRPSRRRYPMGREFAHLIGYCDLAYGLAGIEAADDQRLSGMVVSGPGALDRLGRGLLNHAKARGGDLTLTVDARLQAVIASVLAGRPGAVVALRPADGAVLAMVSSPSFDPDRLEPIMSAPRTAGDPLVNRALQGLYPPGSVFKIAMAGLAVENGFKERLSCPGGGYAAERGARPIRDHEYYEALREDRSWGGHGMLDLRRAFELSSNVFFAQLAVNLGAARVNGIAERLGFDRPVQVFAGSSSAVSAKASELPRLAAADRRGLAQTGIGQGRLLMTPLQAAMLAAMIGNDGEMVAPHLAALPDGPARTRIFSAETARAVRRMMRGAVEQGTGRGADLPGIEVAGKTGTAQTPLGEDHSWFVCLVPADRPTLALAVLIEHGGYGSRSAVPAAARIIEHAQRLGLLDARPPAVHKGGAGP